SVDEGQLELAMSHFVTAAQLAEGDARLRGLLDQIGEEERRARATKTIRDKANALFEDGERLRFSLLGFSGDPRAAWRSIESELATFSVLDDPDWIHRPAIGMLDQPRRQRLIGEVNELLFLWVFAL